MQFRKLGPAVAFMASVMLAAGADFDELRSAFEHGDVEPAPASRERGTEAADAATDDQEFLSGQRGSPATGVLSTGMWLCHISAPPCGLVHQAETLVTARGRKLAPGLTFDAELEATIVTAAKICKIFSPNEK